MPVDELHDRLARLTADRGVDVDAALARVLTRRRNRRLRNLGAGVVVVVGAAVGAMTVQDAGRQDDARVEIVDDPSSGELVVVEAGSRLQDVGEMPDAWGESFVIPFGEAESELGVDKWGPEHPTPAPDGTWWVPDTNKSRLAHFDADGSYLGEVAYPNGGGFQHAFVLGDRLLASGGVGGPFLTATGEAAEEVDVAGVPELATFSYSDGTSVYSDEGVAVSFDERGALSSRPADVFRTPRGDRFRRFVEGSTIVVELLDAGRRVEVDLSPQASNTFAIEVVADIAGTIHVLVIGDDEGRQVAGYFTVGTTGRVSVIEPLRDLGAMETGSPDRLRWIPGTTSVALSYVDDDGLHVYTRDDGDPRSQDENAHVIEEVAASKPFGPSLSSLTVAPDGSLWALSPSGLHHLDEDMHVITSIDVEPNVVAAGFAVLGDGTILSTGYSGSYVSSPDDISPAGVTLYSIAPTGEVRTVATLSDDTAPAGGSRPVLANGRAYVIAQRDVVAVDLDDGRVERSAPIDGLRDLAIAGDEVLAAAEDGVHRLALDDLEDLGVEPTMTSRIVVVDGVAWMREDSADSIGPTSRVDGSVPPPFPSDRGVRCSTSPAIARCCGATREARSSRSIPRPATRSHGARSTTSSAPWRHRHAPSGSRTTSPAASSDDTSCESAASRSPASGPRTGGGASSVEARPRSPFRHTRLASLGRRRYRT